MANFNHKTAAVQRKKISPQRPKLAIVLGSGFRHALTELRAEKSPLRCGNGCNRLFLWTWLKKSKPRFLNSSRKKFTSLASGFRSC
jgi:hypothetical protein